MQLHDQRLDADFKDVANCSLYEQTRAWVVGFYNKELNKNFKKRPSITSHPYFRRKISTPIDKALPIFHKIVNHNETISIYSYLLLTLFVLCLCYLFITYARALLACFRPVHT
ncbi:hypothetical protein LY78DRAFT_478939 [Colletotrichum sublineola]|nr:hypothetical protein LY78DRAFT_478939 [Colletotrichum sublineola]